MRILKGGISILISVIMVICIFTIVPITVSAKTSGDYEYEILEDGTAEISGYSGTENNLQIPSSVNGTKVTSIGCNVFYNRQGLESVVIPNGITNIGSCAFWGCSGLISVIIPKSVCSIGVAAFKGCKKLTKISLSNNITKIESETFYGCADLTEIVIPSTVTEIGFEAFYGCKGLTNVSIPANVKCIAYQVFYGCENLKTVNIPDSVTKIESRSFDNCSALTNITIGANIIYIGQYAFRGCSGLNSIEVDRNNTVYDSRQNCNGIIDSKTNELIYGCKNTVIPNSVSSIANYAFYECSELSSISVPDSVTNIGDYAFCSCEKLNNIIIPDSVTYIGEGAFIATAWYNNQSDGLVYAGKVAYNYKGTIPNNTSIIIKNGTKSITPRAFNNCSGLTEIILPNSVMKIGSFAFYDCEQLTNVVVPETVIEIGSYAFYNTAWYNSKSDGLTYIGKVAYKYKGTMPSGTSIEIQDGTKAIADSCFSQCYGLQSIKIPNTIINIGNGAFYNCSALKSATLPNSVIIIGSTAFSWCTGLTRVNIGNSVEKIGDGAFHNTELQNVVIPKSVNSIGEKAFGYVEGKNEISKIEDYIIYGVLGSEAETYAHKNEITFTNIDQVDTEEPTTTPVAETTESINVTDPPTVPPTDKPTEPATVEPTQPVTEKPTENPKTDSFNWGTDNYNFNNSAPDYFKRSTYRAQINNTYLKALKDNLTNSEYQVVFEGDWGYDAWLDDDWGGSCYGMSSTALLAKRGLLPYADYKAGATELNDLNIPKNDLELSSLITYYQMLQVKDVIQQQYRTIPNNSNETNIKSIIAALDKNPAVLLGFQQYGWGGHAILATGYEYGSWTWDNVTYQGCIKICDPNASLGYDKEFNIYFNTSSYNWTIPGYSIIKSTWGAKFNYIGADINAINEGGYLSGTSGNNVGSYVARINALKISDNRSVSKVKETNGNYTALNASPGEIVEDYAYILGNESEGIVGYNLYDAKSAYKVSQENAQNMQLNIDYEKCRMSGGSQAGKSIIFDNKGIVKVLGESAEYNMSMTFDENYPTDWFTMTVSGEDSDNAVLEKTDEGYILKADKLKNVVVKANNRENSASTMFSTDYDSAFIYEINEKVIGIKVDTDNDGTYDSDIDTVEVPTQETKPIVTDPTTTEPITPPVVTDPSSTEPLVTEPSTPPAVTDPIQPPVVKPDAPKIKKTNPMTVKIKKKTVKAKKLKKKAQKVKAITVKNAQGKITYKLVKSGITKKIRKLVKINSKGVITIKKWKKAKKGTYKIKVKVTAAGNSDYNAKTVTKTVKIKVK